MSDTPHDDQPKRPFRALMQWLKGDAPQGGVAERTPPGVVQPAGAPAPSGRRPHTGLPDRLGHYRIERKLGEGGMGVVYAARDEKLERTVALKTMSSLAHDENARKRFWREARAAAAVNHPNICQIYEIGEDDSVLFIAMELLEGTPLSERLKGAPLGVAETVSTGLGILNALSALHARGVIHRDLKPSNVFLTAHGVKLLDFGLARPTVHEQVTGALDLTRAGAVMGTPRYMSPEQALGEALDGRTDLFAAGAILFEMLAGRPAFTGNTVVAILHATVYEQPPALSGSPAVAAVDRVIRRALAKKASERPATADAMADELRDVPTADDETATMTHPMTRIVVLPFRVLRADPETDFLAFSLPDAITTSLAGIGSLVVRSSATAARFANETPDFKALAAEAGVDRVVSGTILRAGDELRAHVQLVEAPGGTVIASHSVQTPLGDLFQLQDDLARRVVEALALPLGGPSASPSPDAPASARAYELYLRGNDLGRAYSGAVEARDLYERSVALDPNYAPAWARLGRCYRVIGKYIESAPDNVERARQAYDRALELNPKLTIAHKFYANLESDTGQADRAVVRLLNAATRHGNDPELFAGLVHACRYAGLYKESLAAHAEARRLDPNIQTGFEQTLLMTGDLEHMLASPFDETDTSRGDEGIRIIAMGLHGRREDAQAALARMKEQPKVPLFKVWTQHLDAWLNRRVPQMLEEITTLSKLAVYEDPEALFQEGWLLCDVGAHDKGMPFLERGVDRGYLASPVLKRASQFDPLRGTPAFESLVTDAEALRLRALDAFRAAGGERLLGRRDAQ